MGGKSRGRRRARRADLPDSVERRVYELQRASRRGPVGPTYDELDARSRQRHVKLVGLALRSYRRGSFRIVPITEDRMSWSISASGKKPEVKAQLAQVKINPESNDAAEHGAALELVNKLVDAQPDDETFSISCSGHTDSKAQTPARYTSASISFGSSKT